MKLVFLFKKSVRGFTMVELIISISIMVMMTVLLLSNYPESAIKMTLINSTQITSLLIREAQIRGSATDSVNSTLGGYGVYIKIENSNTPSTVKLFGDSVDGSINTAGLPIGNGVFDLSPTDETVSVTSFPFGYRITKVCGGEPPATCYSNVGQSLTISFTRPSPQPDIYLNATKDSKGINYSSACIEIQAPDPLLFNHIRSVNVFNSGMMNTSTSTCS